MGMLRVNNDAKYWAVATAEAAATKSVVVGGKEFDKLGRLSSMGIESLGFVRSITADIGVIRVAGL
jgi:hypothetical protein